MAFLERLLKFFKTSFFNSEWRCLNCGKEIFNGEGFCEECYKTLPFNRTAICDHCGRQLNVANDYCTTCKGKLVNLDKCRSVFVYKQPISALIQNFKYNNRRYLAEFFGEQLALLYLKSYMNADLATYVPMLEKAQRKRGYNQSKLLAEKFCEKTALTLCECVKKSKSTERQAKLGSVDRRKNLIGSFKVANKSEIKDKSIVLIDDVTTTGATAEEIARVLKTAGAKRVFLMSVASVPPKCKY